MIPAIGRRSEPRNRLRQTRGEPLVTTGYPPRNRAMCVYVEGQELAMKRMVSDLKTEKLTNELKDLETQSDEELKGRWHSLYGTKPPQKIHRALLIGAVAHRMQENVLGVACSPKTPANCRRVRHQEETDR
jgi:hypothetical protein